MRFLLADLFRFRGKESCYLASPQFSILTRRKSVVSHVAHTDAAEFDHGVADCIEHASDLLVLTFAEGYLVPGIPSLFGSLDQFDLGGRSS